MIAAPMSGSGKTTVARGLMALLRQKGYVIQPFKCGPDYIDTKFHEVVCGRPSINLDTFMATPTHVHELFMRYGKDADVCVLEGMMGLFDGYDRDKGSSSEIARILGAPIVLVVDAKSAAYSMAALLQGFINFKRDVRIVGVIFNKVGSARHFQMLQQVCEESGVACLGYLPRDGALELGSRYLGLDFSEQHTTAPLVTLLEEHVDWERLLQISALSPAVSTTHDENTLHKNGQSVLIARNAESFSFIYQETIDKFSTVRFFDPQTEVPDFHGIDMLYLPGGYPEKHLEALARAEATREAIRSYAESGGKIFAECGGMMYLCRNIVSDNGTFPMCDVLPYSISARRTDRRLSLGYRQFMLNGKEYRGHEFHYTQFIGEAPQSVAQVYNAKGDPVCTPIIRYKNVLASYTHLYDIV